MKSMEFIQNITTRLRGVVGDSYSTREEYQVAESGNLKDELECAKKDWVYAQNYFQNVTDPALVDHAVYLLEAAEAKYTYLLKQAREVVRG